MNRCRNRAQWVLEPEVRTTISQQIGGLLYDFIDRYPLINLTDGKTKSLLSCVRDETRMCDTTLKRFFRGCSDSISQQHRILIAIHEWVPENDFQRLWTSIGQTFSDFATTEGITFLEEQARLNRPVRKGN